MKKVYAPCSRCGEQPKSYSNEDDFSWYECPRCHIAAAGSYLLSEASANWESMSRYSTSSEDKAKD